MYVECIGRFRSLILECRRFVVVVHIHIHVYFDKVATDYCYGYRSVVRVARVLPKKNEPISSRERDTNCIISQYEYGLTPYVSHLKIRCGHVG